jgi:hypothetical protein
LENHVAPRLSNTRKPRSEPAPIGDNSQAVEEANRVQLISLVAKLSAAEGPIEAASAALKAARKERSKIIGLAKSAGFPAWEIEARLAEMKRGTREMVAIEARERKQRRWLGILDDEQAELILGDKVPPDAKDAAHWAGEGYKAGLRQLPRDPPPECPPMHTQAYMKAHERGLIEVLSANAPKPMGVREQAAADFAADEPESGTYEAQRKEREAIRNARASLERMGEDDGFEASDEELAAQALRPSVQEGEEPVV